ncbi:MAG TPA: hypothetical protein VFZ76_01470 [Anaerolineales bacterium]
MRVFEYRCLDPAVAGELRSLGSNGRHEAGLRRLEERVSVETRRLKPQQRRARSRPAPAGIGWR